MFAVVVQQTLNTCPYLLPLPLPADAVVRLCLGPLNQPQKAFEVVRKSRSVSAADVLVKYCMTNANFQASAPASIELNRTVLLCAAWSHDVTDACVCGGDLRRAKL